MIDTETGQLIATLTLAVAFIWSQFLVWSLNKDLRETRRALSRSLGDCVRLAIQVDALGGKPNIAPPRETP